MLLERVLYIATRLQLSYVRVRLRGEQKIKEINVMFCHRYPTLIFVASSSSLPYHHGQKTPSVLGCGWNGARTMIEVPHWTQPSQELCSDTVTRRFRRGSWLLCNLRSSSWKVPSVPKRLSVTWARHADEFKNLLINEPRILQFHRSGGNALVPTEIIPFAHALDLASPEQIFCLS